MKAMIRLGVCTALLFGGAALAQTQEMTPPPGEPGPVVEPGAERTETVTFEERRKKYNAKGAYIFIGGGAEGYTGELAPAVNPGFAWGAQAGVKPLNMLGIEVAYSGAVNDIDLGRGNTGGGVTNGADIVRNGGHVAATLDFTDSRLSPYLLGGIGVEHYNVRGGQELGFRDDTNGFVPAGLGLRYQLTDTIAADLRGTYNFSFDQEFAPFPTNSLGDNRYQGLLQLGGSF